MAGMLSLASVQVPESFSEYWTGHLYTLCSLAIPMLPVPKSDCSEEEMMDTIGMKKDKAGKYEKFEKFLPRTEGLISIMAEGMCTIPTSHRLLGGCKGALKWLERFLDLLPRDQCTLPLVTAPTLIAFLTAAGHMLANVYESDFRPLLDRIINEISEQLDKTPVGQPSATRLKKLLGGGFDFFRDTLPPGAVKGLYNTIGMTDETAINPMSFGGGGNNMSAPNIFGGGANNQPAPNAFGGGANNQPTQSTFGGGDNNMSEQSPFGGGANDPPAQNNFGGGANNQPALSPFGGGANNAPAPSPFGGGANNVPAPSPFGGGTNNAPAPSPFGDGGNNMSEQTPFGASNNGASLSSPFGMSNNAPEPSPFGGGANNIPA